MSSHQYVLITSLNTKEYIGDKHLQAAYSDLLSAGFNEIEAANLALDFCIGRVEATLLSVSDQLLGKSSYPRQLNLLAKVNSVLEYKTSNSKSSPVSEPYNPKAEQIPVEPTYEIPIPKEEYEPVVRYKTIR